MKKKHLKLAQAEEQIHQVSHENIENKGYLSKIKKKKRRKKNEKKNPASEVQQQEP